MKKNVLKFTVIFCVLLGVISCKKNGTDTPETTVLTAEEIELKGFMVGGVYAFTGYGGVSEVETMANENGTEKEDLVKSYHELLNFPFQKSEGASTRSTLKEYWDIDSKATLVETLEDLKNTKDPKNPHKAWDYARVVNNVWMGYSADYLTEDEAKKQISATLALAQKDFKTWADFFKDYNQGRLTWNPESEDKDVFTKASEEILKNDIYKMLPLN
jgi:hypothetical protein